MNITYRTKSNKLGVGIQIDYHELEKNTVELIRMELEPLGFTFKPSPLPDSFPSAMSKYGKTCYFHKQGSNLFGLFHEKEADAFIKQSFPILKKYDDTIKKIILMYDNN